MTREEMLERALMDLSCAALSYTATHDPRSLAVLNETMREADELILGGFDERSKEHSPCRQSVWSAGA